MRRVTLVCGPPCAGKSTYVAQHAKPGDVILDQDVIGARTMRQGLARVAAMTDGTAWVIRCSPGPSQRDALARQIHATDVILLRPSEPELIARAAHRPNPRRHIQAVRDWLQREAEDRGRKTRGASRTPRASRTTTEQGYGWEHQKARRAALLRLRDGDPCSRCQQPMYRSQARSLDLDHTEDRTTYRGLAHARCNRQAGQALGIARRRARTRTRAPDAKPAINTAVNSRAW